MLYTCVRVSPGPIVYICVYMCVWLPMYSRYTPTSKNSFDGWTQFPKTVKPHHSYRPRRITHSRAQYDAGTLVARSKVLLSSDVQPATEADLIAHVILN